MPLPKVSSAKLCVSRGLCGVGVSHLSTTSIDLEKVVISRQRVADPAAAQPPVWPTLTGGRRAQRTAAAPGDGCAVSRPAKRAPCRSRAASSPPSNGDELHPRKPRRRRRAHAAGSQVVHQVMCQRDPRRWMSISSPERVANRRNYGRSGGAQRSSGCIGKAAPPGRRPSGNSVKKRHPGTGAGSTPGDRHRYPLQCPACVTWS